MALPLACTSRRPAALAAAPASRAAGAVPSLCRGASNASRRGNTAAGVGQVRERGGAARALQSEREGTVRSDSGASNSGCPLDFKQMDWELWHYKPFSYWFLRPGFVVSCGVGFIVSANLLTEPCLHTTLLAGAPVALLLFIYLRVLPSQFRRFAIDYMQSHSDDAPKPAAETATDRGRRL